MAHNLLRTSDFNINSSLIVLQNCVLRSVIYFGPKLPILGKERGLFISFFLLSKSGLSGKKRELYSSINAVELFAH